MTTESNKNQGFVVDDAVIGFLVGFFYFIIIILCMGCVALAVL